MKPAGKHAALRENQRFNLDSAQPFEVGVDAAEAECYTGVKGMRAPSVQFSLSPCLF